MSPKAHSNAKRLRFFGFASDARVISYLLAVSVGAGLVSPRTFSFSVPVLVALLLIRAFRTAKARNSDLRVDSIVLSLLAFYALASASALWSAAPSIAFSKGTAVVAIAVLTLICGLTVRDNESKDLARAMSVGYAVGIAFIGFEVFSNQAIKLFVINLLKLKEGEVKPWQYYGWVDGRAVSAHLSTLNRNILAVVLLFWPVLLTFAHNESKLSRFLAVACGVLVLSLVIGSGSETAKLALFCGLIAAAGAYLSPVWAWRSIAIAWILSCMLIVPVVKGAHSLDLHRTKVLEEASVGARIGIANEYADRILQRPMFGHGFNMSYVLGPKIDAETQPDVRVSKGGWMSQHPHNAYMQIWFELGGVGAFLFMWLGLTVLRRAWDVPDRVKPFSMATFAAWAAAIAPSYGIWQYWFLSVFSIMAVLFAISDSESSEN
jgi:hypothetical protein